jgi:hypothetical protein
MDFVSFFNAVTPAYEIEQSLRFDGSSHLNKALSTPTNAKTGTLSFWAKRSPSTGVHTVYQSNSNEIYTGFDNNSSGDNTYGIYLTNNSTKQVRVTTQLFRDPSAWYHIVIKVDTTQSSAADRLKLYVNGSEVTAFGTSNAVDQNDDVFPASTYRIGSYSGTTEYYQGYLAEFHYVDGTASDPTDFGEYDDNGVWIPKRYSGSYGTNGYYLKFDSTATNGIGHDHSGNGNNWTASGFTTSGTGTDVMSDTPTTNWCTVNPLSQRQLLNTSNGNLEINYTSTGSGSNITATQGASSGKYYWETTITSGSSVDYMAAVTSDWDVMNTAATAYPGQNANGWSYYRDGRSYHNGSFSSYGDSYTTRDVIGVALDLDNNKIYFSKNGIFQNSGNPITGANPAFSNVSGTVFPCWAGYYPGTIHTCNFGQREFANRPGDTVGATSYFNTVTYTANNQSTNAVTGVGFQPDLVWLKTRSRNEHHYLYDAVRGVGNRISTSQTIAEVTGDNTFTSFDSDGFTLGSDGAGIANYQTDSMVAWCWKAGGTGSANNSGSLNATVSASQDAGFSIATYTGNSTSGATFAHGLGTAPSVVIVKNIDSGSQGWMIYHSGMGATKAIQFTANGELTDTAYWNDTAPSSTLVTLGNDNATNANGDDYVAYCWAEKTGVSKFGEYTGNGSSDGPVISCGFRPAMVMIKWYKDVSTSESWQIYDNKRDGNPNNTVLAPDANADDESPSDRHIQFTTDGFQLKANGQQINRSGAKYIFMAFAGTFTAGDTYKTLNTANLSAPTVKDGSDHFNAVAYAGNSSTQSINVGFQPDFLWLKSRTQGYSHWLVDSIRGTHAKLSSDSTAAENTDTTKNPIEQFTSTGFDLQYTADDGLTYSDVNASGQNFIAWNWLAGNGTSSNTDGSITSTVSANPTAGFSIATYTGNATSGATVGHGLGVQPSMIIIKNRDEPLTNWLVGHVGITLGSGRLTLDSTASNDSSNAAVYWNSTAASSTVVTLGNSSSVNRNGDSHVMYCFAEVEGYSKFGSYTGNGLSDGPFVYCGFKPAWLLIKRTDSSSDWILQDNKRLGYNVDNNDLIPNQTYAEATDDRLDQLSNGFKLRSTFTTSNASGGTYVFIALAENPFGGSGVSPACAR